MTNISHKWSCLQETNISSTSLNYFHGFLNHVKVTWCYRHGYHNVNGFNVFSSLCPWAFTSEHVNLYSLFNYLLNDVQDLIFRIDKGNDLLISHDVASCVKMWEMRRETINTQLYSMKLMWCNHFQETWFRQSCTGRAIA